MKKIYVNINNDFLLNNNFLEEISLNEEVEININFISDFKSAKILRDFLSIVSDKLNISNIWKSRLILIIDELNNNAIEYGSRPGDINTFKIGIHLVSNTLNLNIEVSDSGKGEESKTAKEMILLRNKKKLNGFFKNNGIRGRGLFMIIEKLVDKLYFKDGNKGGLIVGINKKLKSLG